MVKSKVLPHNDSLWIPSTKRDCKAFLKKILTQDIKATQKNESELGVIYVLFIYRSISFYRQHLKIICKLCTPVHLEVYLMAQFFH